MSQEIEKKMSERERVNEYLAMKRIENENNYQIATVRSLSVFPVWRNLGVYSSKSNEGTISYLISNFTTRSTTPDFGFYYVCELYLPIRDKIVYVIVSEINEFIDSFSKDISMDNDIDKNINFENKKKVKINIDTINYSIKIMKKDSTKNRYNKTDNIKVKYEFAYYDDIESFISINLDNTGSDSLNLFNFSLLLENKYEAYKSVFRNKNWKYKDKLESSFIHEVTEIQEELSINKIKNTNLYAQIIDISVDTKIKLTVEAKNIIHDESLEYNFDKPTEKNEEFLNFCKKMDVDSVDELEMKPILLSRKSGITKESPHGWYIKSKTKSVNKENNKSIIHRFKSLVSI